MDNTRKYLSFIVTILGFTILSAVLWIGKDQKEVVFSILTGTLQLLGILMGFYYSSSEGSQAKTGIIKNLADQTEKKVIQEEKEEKREEIADKKDELKREVFTEKDHEKREEFTEKEVENLKGDKP